MHNVSLCIQCNKPLTKDEIAITKKLVNRGAVSFYCLHCLASHFEVTEEDIIDKIQYFKESGCTLFDR